VAPLRSCLRVSSCFVAGLVLPMVGVAAQQTKPPAESPLVRQMHQAVNAAQHGEERQALVLTQALLAQHPDFVPALKLRGELLESAGRKAEAGATYVAALKLAPNDAELLLKVGVDRLLAGDTDQAISLLRRRSKLVPNDGECQYYLAQAYHLKGDGELALKAIRESVKLQPDNASVWQKYGELLCSTGNNEGAMRWLLKAQAADTTLDRIDFDLSVASYNNMDFPHAVAYATKAAESHPNDLTMLALLAAAEVRLSHWEEAKAVFARILAAKPDDVPSLLGMGHCELELKETQAAVETLEHLLQLDPTQVLAHFYLSRGYRGLGQMEQAQHEAALHARMMQQISFTLPKGEMQRDQAAEAKARQLLADRHEEEALRLFQENSSGPSATRAGAYVQVGAVYISIGDTDAALRCFDRALAIDPKARGANTYKGILALQLGDLSQAENDFQAELAIDPNHPLAVAELGEVRYRQGRWSEAADQLVKSKTSIPTLLYMLCDSYFRMGKVVSADLTAETLAAYGRGEPEVMLGLIDLLNRNSQLDLAQRLSQEAKP
jgi:tetratricopeptide (TPR) repeat protein